MQFNSWEYGKNLWRQALADKLVQRVYVSNAIRLSSRYYSAVKNSIHWFSSVVFETDPSLQDVISCCDPVYIIFIVDLLFLFIFCSYSESKVMWK